LSDDGRPAHGQGLSIVSLVLGLCGVGVGAIITGIIALVQKRPGRGMAWTGVILGSIGTFFAVLITAGALGMIWYTAMEAESEPNCHADSAWATPATNRMSESDKAGDEQAAILEITEWAEAELGILDREIEALRAELPDPDEWAREHGAGEGPEWFVPVYHHMAEARICLDKLYDPDAAGVHGSEDSLVKKLKDELAAAHEELERIRTELR
jgi:hypothetical protein